MRQVPTLQIYFGLLFDTAQAFYQGKRRFALPGFVTTWDRRVTWDGTEDV